jgi:hypothetical protein
VTGKLDASGRSTTPAKSTLLRRLCVSAIVGKELVALARKAQLLHHLSDGDWTGSSTRREVEARREEECMGHAGDRREAGQCCHDPPYFD